MTVFIINDYFYHFTMSASSHSDPKDKVASCYTDGGRQLRAAQIRGGRRGGRRDAKKAEREENSKKWQTMRKSARSAKATRDGHFQEKHCPCDDCARRAADEREDGLRQYASYVMRQSMVDEEEYERMLEEEETKRRYDYDDYPPKTRRVRVCLQCVHDKERTALRRHFDGIHEVVEDDFEDAAEQLLAQQAADWLRY